MTEATPLQPTVSGSGAIAALITAGLSLAHLGVVAQPAWLPKAALLPAITLLALFWLTRRRHPLVPPAAFLSCWIFLGLAVASTLLGSNPDLSLVGPWGQGTGLILLVASAGCWVLGLRLTQADRRLLAVTWLAAAGFNALVAALTMSLDLSEQGLTRFLGRAPGLMQTPAILGPFLVAALPLLMCRFRNNRLAIGAGAGVVGLGTALAGSRAGLALAAVAVAWGFRRVGIAAAALTIGGLILGVLVAPVFDRPPSPVSEAFATPDSEIPPASPDADLADHDRPPADSPARLANRPIGPRLSNWLAARHAVARRPFLGEGPGQFRAATIADRPPQVSADTPDAYFTDAHNFVVELAVTVGLPALVAALCWLALAGREAQGPWAVVAVMLGAAHLIQPLNVSTTPLALLALGAAVPRIQVPQVAHNSVVGRLVAALLAGAGLIVGMAMLLGGFWLRAARLDFTLADAVRADLILRIWPQPASARGLVHQYRWASGAKGEAHPAEVAFREAASRDPANPAHWTLLAEVLRSHGRLGPAQRAVDRALALDPQSPRALAAAARIARDRRADHQSGREEQSE